MAAGSVSGHQTWRESGSCCLQSPSGGGGFSLLMRELQTFPVFLSFFSLFHPFLYELQESNHF